MSHRSPPPPEPLLVRPALGIPALLAVANTRHGPAGHFHARVSVDGPDHDHLREPADGRAFLADHGVPIPPGMPDPHTIVRLIEVREVVRSLAGGDNGPPVDARVSALATGAAFTLGPDFGLRAVGGGWPALVSDLVPPLLRVAADRSRLRICGNPLCRFAFFDTSRAAARVWCDPAACGNRIRVRRHRGRGLGAEPSYRSP